MNPPPPGTGVPARPLRRTSYPDLSPRPTIRPRLTEVIPPGSANRSGKPIEALGWILLDEQGRPLTRRTYREG